MAAQRFALTDDLALGRLIQAGDEAAVTEMIERHHRFIYKLARRWGRTYPWLDEDLQQAAFIGALTAARKYDPRRGMMFCTYAAHWINREMHTLLVKQSHAVRVPQRAREKGKRVRVVSLDTKTAGDDSAALVHRIPQSVFRDPVEAIHRRERRAALRRALAQLEPRLRTIVTLRKGLDGDGERKLHEVAEVVGVGKERVRQLERIALHRLHRILGAADPRFRRNEALAAAQRGRRRPAETIAKMRDSALRRHQRERERGAA